jgi:hypothetical protein
MTELPEENERPLYDELQKLGLCRTLSPSELRTSENENKKPRHSLRYGLNCGALYAEVRAFLFDSVIPAFIDQLRKPLGQSTEKTK